MAWLKMTMRIGKRARFLADICAAIWTADRLPPGDFSACGAYRQQPCSRHSRRRYRGEKRFFIGAATALRLAGGGNMRRRIAEQCCSSKNRACITRERRSLAVACHAGMKA